MMSRQGVEVDSSCCDGRGNEERGEDGEGGGKRRDGERGERSSHCLSTALNRIDQLCFSRLLCSETILVRLRFQHCVPQHCLHHPSSPSLCLSNSGIDSSLSEEHLISIRATVGIINRPRSISLLSPLQLTLCSDRRREGEEWGGRGGVGRRDGGNTDAWKSRCRGERRRSLEVGRLIIGIDGTKRGRGHDDSELISQR